MLSLRRIVWINIFVFSLYLLSVVFLSITKEIVFFRYLHSLLTLFILFPLTGVNISSLLERVTHQKFDLLERAAIAIILALVIPPLLLTLEYTALPILSPTLPILNALIIALAAMLLTPYSLDVLRHQKALYPLSWATVSLAALLYSMLAIYIVKQYYFLPDSDPYYWYMKAQQEFKDGMLPALHGHRPLFSSLTYLFHSVADIDLYAIFKYVLPFLSLPLFLFPTMLVARFFSQKTSQLAILLTPLSSASIILYSLLPIPQAIINVGIVFFIFFILYAWLKGETFFYFFSGAFISIFYFYHEMAVFFFLPWLFVTLALYRTPLITWIRVHKGATILFFALLLSHLSLIFPVLNFVKNWFIRISEKFADWHTNLTFPLTFINVDGHIAGWGTLTGVIKYYAFYTGPAVIITVSILGYIIFSDRSRKVPKLHFWNRAEFLTLFSVFAVFFTLAEILPRLLNIALLPERSWGFAGLIILSASPFILNHPHNKNRLFTLALLFGIVLNISAAVYINSLKIGLVPKYQMTSAQWIKNTLPDNKILFIQHGWDVMKIYAQAEFIEIPDQRLYTDIDIFDEALNKNTHPAVAPTQPCNSTLDTDITYPEKTTGAEIQQGEISPQKEIYVYYAKPSSSSLYAERPYYTDLSTNEPVAFIFDAYPARFKRVYVLPNETVIIWKLLQ